MELTKLTFAMIKPDAVAAKNSGKIIDIIEHNDFEIVRMQKVMIAKDLAEEFYAEHKDKPFFQELVEFIISAPVILMALHKEDAIVSWRELIGATDPAKAAEGTIRYAYGTDIGKNAVHGSLDSASAAIELELFFPDLFEYEDQSECSDNECDDDH
ncbi:MAG TPA: nucleoside-diphosphate kinase [Candidatus Babeliales bacterium]|nr:nucleoside-diphosphate kinase [Candidatus Babeliales bacterium]